MSEGTAESPDPAVAARPGPALRPVDVVAAQLAGLQREPQAGSAPGPGLRAAWAFASPGNRAATGPLERFAALLRSEAYVGLLEHRVAQLGPVVVDGEQARQEVLVLTRDDRALGFTWVLGRQQGPPLAGCWLTEGVLRHADRPGLV